MKILLSSIIAVIIVTETAFAGAGTLFKGGIGLPDWQFASSVSAKKNPGGKTALKKPLAKSSPRDQRVTVR